MGKDVKRRTPRLLGGTGREGKRVHRREEREAPAAVAGPVKPWPVERQEWRTNLILRQDQRDALEDLGERVRRATRYRPTASELVRAAVDASLDALRAEDLRQLAELVEGKGAREAGPTVEGWIRKRLADTHRAKG